MSEKEQNQNDLNSFVDITLIHGKKSAFITIGDDHSSNTWAVNRFEMKLLLNKLLEIEDQL